MYVLMGKSSRCSSSRNIYNERFNGGLFQIVYVNRIQDLDIIKLLLITNAVIIYLQFYKSEKKIYNVWRNKSNITQHLS